MSRYEIFLNDERLCITDWPPIAQAAWNRAARDRDAAQHGGAATLVKDGQTLSSVQPRTKTGQPWPDSDEPESTWHDVVRGIVRLLRDDEWTPREIADAMTAEGLPTTRSRIDALRGSSKGSRTAVVPAELVVMLQAVLRQYRGNDR